MRSHSDEIKTEKFSFCDPESVPICPSSDWGHC